MKTQVVWTIHVPLEGFAGYNPVFFCFHSFYEQLEDWCKWHMSNGLKTLMSQKAICPLIHNPSSGLTGKWPYVTKGDF